MDEEENMLTVAAAVSACVVAITKKKRKKKRLLWAHNWLRKRDSGLGVLNMCNNELLREDPRAYRNFLRMSNNKFEELLAMVVKKIEKQDTFMRDAVSARQRLQVTLRFLATGESFTSLQYAMRIHQTTITRIIPEVIDAIISALKDTYLKVPHSEEEWRQIAFEFNQLWQFPHCVGALDGRHIKFRPLRSDGSYFFNYKETHSIVLLGLVDANYKFLYVNIGAQGRISDGGVFRESNLSEALKTNQLHFPPLENLPNSNIKVPYVIVADEAFPLTPQILKPYPQRDVQHHDNRIFNYRLSRARRIVENAFGILANRFRVLLNPINLVVDKVNKVTVCCVALHNFLAAEGRGGLYLGDQEERFHTVLEPLGTQAGNHSSGEARAYRDAFRTYFCTSGAVAWQETAITNYNL